MAQSFTLDEQRLYALSRIYEPPDFVKKASAEQLMGNDGLPAHVYGDPRNREFPCHTAPATWYSLANLLTYKEAANNKVADLIQKRIEAAGRHHGIIGSLQHLKEAVARNQISSEENLPDDDFAMVIQWSDGSRERHYPLRNQKEIKEACSYLKEYRDNFVFDDRAIMATKVLEKAAELKVDLVNGDKSFLEKQAGIGFCSAQDAAEILFNRAKTLRTLKRDPDMQLKLASMAKACLEAPSLARVPDNLRKIASAVDAVDSGYRLTKMNLPRPEDVLFSLTMDKMASAVEDHVRLTSGSIYKKSDLANVRLDDLRNLGDDFADAVSEEGLFLSLEKLSEVAPTLPRGSAEIFDSLMTSINVKPVYKQAAVAQTIDDESLQKLASLVF